MRNIEKTDSSLAEIVTVPSGDIYPTNHLHLSYDLSAGFLQGGLTYFYFILLIVTLKLNYTLCQNVDGNQYVSLNETQEIKF